MNEEIVHVGRYKSQAHHWISTLMESESSIWELRKAATHLTHNFELLIFGGKEIAEKHS